MKIIFSALLVFILFQGQAAANETKIHFLMKAFISKEHPNLPNYVIKTENKSYVIEAPKVIPINNEHIENIEKLIHKYRGKCFSTDNRVFSKDPNASARITVEFILKIKGRTVELSEPDGRESIRIGASKLIDCKTGKQIGESRTASTKTVKIGSIKKSKFLRVFNISGEAGIPFYDVLGFNLSPRISFDIAFQYDVLRKKIAILGSTGVFPSFEIYYKKNNNPYITVLNRSPYEKSTAADLFDFGLGINTHNFKHEISLR